MSTCLAYHRFEYLKILICDFIGGDMVASVWMRSCKIIGFFFRPSASRTNLTSFPDIIKDNIIPLIIRLDKGRDFEAHFLKISLRVNDLLVQLLVSQIGC